MDSSIWWVSYYSPRQMEESIIARNVLQKLSKPIFFHNSLKKFFFRNSLKKLFFLTVNCKKCFSKVFSCFLPLFLIWFWSITLKWLIFNIYFWKIAGLRPSASGPPFSEELLETLRPFLIGSETRGPYYTTIH